MFGFGYSGQINEKLKSIIQEDPKMSARPAYTSGRGANLGDLNSDQITRIYKRVIEVFGEKAGKGYVKMVEDLKRAGASDFLIALYDLCNNGWKPLKTQPVPIQVDKDENGEYTKESIDGAMFGVIESMFSTGRDDTPSIVEPFLRKYSKKYKSDSRNGIITREGRTYYQ